MGVTINVRNHSTVISDADVQDIVDAMQIQDTRDFAHVWGLDDCVYRLVGVEVLEIAGIWELVLLDNSDQAGALGYHDLTTNGDPLGKVFAKDDIKDGCLISVTTTHEGQEMRVDPSINLCAVVENNDNTSTFYALEVSDACEDDAYAYEVVTAKGKKIKVSDFVFPRWFEDYYQKGSKYDFMGFIDAPLKLLKNGYIGVNKGQGWGQITAQLTNPRLRTKILNPSPGHRRTRRVLGAKNFVRSVRPAMKNLIEP